MARRLDWRRVKQKRTYTADEAARVVGVATVTVRRWLKSGLPALAERRPALIIGEDLIAFLKGRKSPKQKCGPAECFCFKCKSPRKPAFGEVEILPVNVASGNMRALCETCTSIMHKRVSLSRLPDLAEKFGLIITLACERLDKTP
jgi:hypothetical protein